MDFSLNEEQQMLKKSARDFLKSKYDKTVLRELEATSSGHSSKLWKEMAKLDWLGIIIPEEYGGVGWGLMELAILFEELGRAAFDGAVMSTAMGTMMLLEGGSESIKKKLLPKIAQGKAILTVAVEEQNVSYDPKWISVSAEKKDDGYCINGTKMFVPYAEIADHILVAARTSAAPGKADGVSIFMVDKKTPGMSILPIDTLSPEKQYQVCFDSVAVGSDAVIGELDKGLQIIKSVYNNTTALQCVEMVGGAQNELEITAEYTKKREQFDRPIGTFQAVQHGLANMFTDVQGARWTSYQATSLLSKGSPAARELAIAKAFTSDACQRVAYGAQQFHGGIGVDLDYDLHFYFRRAKAMDLKFGSTQIHLNALSAELIS
jgi:alkylation response protein AidB-like acyl-CoA dehydrogenase